MLDILQLKNIRTCDWVFLFWKVSLVCKKGAHTMQTWQIIATSLVLRLHGHKIVKGEILLLAFRFPVLIPSWLFFLCPLFCKHPFLTSRHWQNSTVSFVSWKVRELVIPAVPSVPRTVHYGCAIITSPVKYSLFSVCCQQPTLFSVLVFSVRVGGGYSSGTP